MLVVGSRWRREPEVTFNQPSLLADELEWARITAFIVLLFIVFKPPSWILRVLFTSVTDGFLGSMLVVSWLVFANQLEVLRKSKYLSSCSLCLGDNLPIRYPELLLTICMALDLRLKGLTWLLAFEIGGTIGAPLLNSALDYLFFDQVFFRVDTTLLPYTNFPSIFESLQLASTTFTKGLVYMLRLALSKVTELCRAPRLESRSVACAVTSIVFRLDSEFLKPSLAT